MIAFERNLLILLGLTLCIIVGCCPHKTVSGKIEDVDGVLVTISGNGISTNTFTDGKYYFAGLEKGSYTIEPKKKNTTFNPTKRDIEIEKIDISEINFTKIVKNKYLYLVTHIGNAGSIFQLKNPEGTKKKIASNLNNLLGIAVYKDHIYWVDGEEGGRIVEAKTDGSQIKILSKNLGNIKDVAVRSNVNPKEVYWIEKTAYKKSRIRKGTVNNEDNIENIEDLLTELSAPITLEIDIKNNRLYWVDLSQGLFWISFDGRKSGNVTYGNLHFATIDIEDRLFYCTTTIENPAIIRVNTDGTQFTSLLHGPYEGVKGIVLDKEGKKLYWANRNGSVISADLNGENQNTIEKELEGIPYDIAISDN